MRIRITLLFVLLTSAVYSQNTRQVSGKITDVNQQPLVGANVHILNTNLGAVTDREGKFAIDNVRDGKYKLEITAVGFAGIRQDITVSESSEPLAFQLKEAYVQLDAVIVTAQKQEEDLREIPASISALSSRQVQQYRVWNTNEITAIVPNLYSANSGDNRNVTSIRGITSTSYDPAVATYLDGVNQFGLDTYIAQLFDVERIEVLRGPQGTLYGRNAMGGVINVIAKQPTNTTNGFIEFGYGNYGQQRYSNALKIAMIPNKLFVGAATVTEKSDGFYDNAFNNTNFDRKNSFTGNYFLKFLASPKLAFTVNVKHSRNRNYGAFTLAGTTEDAFATPFVVNQNATAKMIDNVFNSSLTAAYVGNKFNFTSQTTYQSNYRYYDKPLDGDFSPADIVTIINNYGNDWNNVKVYTQEFKIQSPANAKSRVRWTAGTYWYYQKNPVKQATRFGDDAGYYGIPDTNFSTISTTTGRNDGLALYGQASYRFMDKLELTLGARYDQENKETSAKGEYQHDPDPNPMFETLADTTASVSYNAFSPKGSVAYHLTTNNQFYATYSRGFRTGGLTQLSSDPSQPPLHAYKPEYSNNFEIGLKNTFFDDKLKMNISAFIIEVRDAQVPTLVLPDAITVVRNTGSLKSQGVELELAATPVKGLQIEYNGGTTNATYRELKLAQQGSEVDLKGKRQIFTPELTSMLALQYQLGVGASKRLKVIARGEWMHLGEQYFDLSNNVRQAPYNLLNTRFGLSYDQFELMFWGRNLSDEKYIAYAYDFGATRLGNPKTYGMTLRLAF
jgi:iron complex outermembrane recepter protein